MSEISLTRFKRCSKCRMWWPAAVEFFYRRSGRRVPLQTYCKCCRRIISREWARANKDRHAEFYAKWYAENKQQKLRYNAHWHVENQELRMLQNAEWRKANPEASRAIGSNRRARERLAEGQHAAEEVMQMYEDQDGLCAYCEMPLFGGYEVDHMQPISRGGRNDWTNLAISCKPCNRQKKDRTAEEFMALKYQLDPQLLGG